MRDSLVWVCRTASLLCRACDATMYLVRHEMMYNVRHRKWRTLDETIANGNFQSSLKPELTARS